MRKEKPVELEKLNELREMLELRKRELQTITIHSEHNLRELLAPDQDEEAQLDTNHPADMVVGDPDYDKGIALIRRERAELALISSALARMDQGTYGQCEECGQEIPLARLEAIPYTKYCIGCKEDKDAAAQLGQNMGAEGSNPHDVGNLGV
ncbi:MAG TPA: TraR/DksA C4-type zinc finger protein [Oligoflexus sp.]|uniref:TraR/DksA C4-type zinc finger protein n=1 Tax=Oligoflexus sp. TaxID=1971216 RepID=UPI002D7E3CF0|nr:TraR/DksA C4-type zinc finger protein [Oligoflexus sp.]HET9236873.1 TraR/DksA C4-type zinc finger protein [Oligoflexus sp.]